MSYATTLASVFGKKPIWLYEFITGGETFRWARRGEDYTDSDSVVWTAAPVAHSKIRRTSAIGRAQTEIVFPRTNAMAQAYRDDPGYEDNEVRIYHEFLDTTPAERQQRYFGRIIAAKPMLARIVLIAENQFTVLRRKGLSAVIQRPCRHALYHSKDGLGCGVNIASFEESGTLTAFNGKTATVSGADAFASGYFSGGVLTYAGRRQMIVKHSGTTLTLLGPILGLSADLATYGSLAVSLAPGCDLTRATCRSRFNNLANFGGFPWADESPYDGKTLF